MMLQPHILEQEVLNNNKEIFARIVKELEGADFEILVASSWFTDDDLFEIIIRKAKQQVNIQLIIADNQENQRLAFDDLIELGASVTRIKNNGYGMMHQKFCVIDKRVALHGSYNWSLNARKNNHESIIVTNHPETVSSLITNFNDISQKANLQKDEDVIQPDESLLIHNNPEKQSAKEHAINEFTKVLDSMIASEIGNFDRVFLRGQGYERSKFNNGDHQVLTKSLDTVYSVFINDIDVVEDKKRRLLSKIDEQEAKSIMTFEESLTLQLQTAEIGAENETLNAKNKIVNLVSDQAKNKQEIESLTKEKIVYHQNIIEQIKEKVRHARKEFVKPRFRWYEFIPVLIANICLLTYLFIFYSSACYILIFAVEDSKAARAENLDAIPMEVFNPKALTQTFEKGGAGILFILLFVGIPVFCALIKLFTKNRIVVFIMIFLGIALVDTAIAYKVSAAIHQMKYESGDTNQIWQMSMAFKDPNFYLVFLLGGLGLIMLKFAFEKLMNIFEERNPDLASLKNDMVVAHMEEDMKAEEQKILLIKDQIFIIEGTNINLEAQHKITEIQLDAIPINLNLLRQIKHADLITGKQHIKDIATIYKSHVENDNLPISVDALNDRINIFLEGWNDYLHEHYAILIASRKSREAFDTTISWQLEKNKTSHLDRRVAL